MKENKISRRSFLKFGAAASAVGMMAAAPVAANAAQPDADAAADEENCLLGLFQKPKYIFLFIGDGMGTAQIQSARFYKGTVDNNGAVTEADLSFTGFPTVGSVTTYDSTSFCPDSASTATSIATGHKTESGVINMCPWTRDVPYETIAEKLHAQKGYKVGIISSVNIDHATPAAFYAHQKTRKNYYQIGVELANSGFEYFAGGEFQKVNGDGTGPNNHEVAAQAGYNVVTTQAGAAALTAGAGKTLIIAENLADGKAMNYAMDAAAGEWQLTDYVKKGIELLDNPKGFFLMTESGKLGFIGGMELDTTKGKIAGFEAAAKYVGEQEGKTVELLAVPYANSFSDAPKGKEFATELISQGADVFFGDASAVDSGAREAIDAANEKAGAIKIYDIGQPADILGQNPCIICSQVTDNAAMIEVCMDAVVAGNFGGNTVFGTLENGALSAGAINTELVPAEKVEKYNAYLQQMMDGTFMK